MITKEKIVEILKNKWNRSNLLYSEIADEILALEMQEKVNKLKLEEQIANLKHGEWYNIKTNMYNYLIKLSSIKNGILWCTKIVCEKTIFSSNLREFCNILNIQSITPATKEEVEKYFPDEFKVKLDYEILEFTSKNSGCKAIKNDRGTFDSDNFANMEEERLLADSRSLITKIKRLSDGEVFTIGDKVTDIIEYKFNTTFTITNIKLFNKKIELYLNNGSYYLLDGCKKFKQPILVTEDGVVLFEGDKYWYLPKHQLYKANIRTLLNTDELVEGTLRFSTKEAADEYILLNKPCLSYNDLINSIEDNGLLKSVMTMRILKLVKSKLK